MTAAKKTQQTRRNIPDGRAWNSREVAELVRLAPFGAQVAADTLGRTVKSVRAAAARRRISLRQAGERRGLVLGQPRGQSWVGVRDTADRLAIARAVRSAVLAGELDPARLEARARQIAAIAAGAPLCPWCTSAPVEVATTGLCRECHLKALAEAHRQETREDEAQRELWRARQEKSRARRAAAAAR